MHDAPALRQRFANATAAFMFWLSLFFLANTATLIVVWVDVPRVEEAYVASLIRTSTSTEELRIGGELEKLASQIGNWSLCLALLLWPVFWLEFAIYFFVGGQGTRLTRAGLLGCFFPPLRLAATNPEFEGQLWLPRVGWTKTTDEIRDRLEKVFGLPMIFIALMILPILLVEFGLREQISERLWLRALLHVSTGVIWFAFAVEFILMYSVASKKLQYCKEHWLDLAIILLPLISFLRSLRLVRATRLARLAKVQHLAKMGRIYRLRGLFIKALRALLLFEVLDRLLPVSLERRARSLREQLIEKEKEVAVLRQQLEEIEEKIEAEKTEEMMLPTEDALP